MTITDFARIRNAKALLLTPDKRVLHFPKTNKVRIDNMNPEREYPEAFVESIRKEYNNADKAARATGLVPPVQNYRELGNTVSYTQNYAGTPLPKRFKGINSKEQYKLGSQVGRIQNRLLKEGLGHTDIHEGNIVKPDVNKRQVKLIDNDAIKNMNTKYDEAEMKNLYWKKSLGKPFMTGYNSRINFTQQEQMQHFANFGFEQLVGQAKNLGQQGLNKAKTLGYAAKNVAGDISQMRGTQIGAGLGAVAGLARGAGAGETEEERANTTALGRVGKVFGNTAGGATVGGALGLGAQVSGYPQKLGKYTRNKVADITKQPVQGELF
jgi:tRNA A-37 threonylcarbamoyl transferase component Bud32